MSDYEQAQIMKKMHSDLVGKGLPPKMAAKLVQATTGLSAVTGKPIQNRKTKVGYNGQYK